MLCNNIGYNFSVIWDRMNISEKPMVVFKALSIKREFWKLEARGEEKTKRGQWHSLEAIDINLALKIGKGKAWLYMTGKKYC